MMRTNEPACGHLDAAGMGSELLARLRLSLPEMHTDGASMARLTRGMREDKAAALCALPFCCTVEAEALGAAINLGDAGNGPRAAGFSCLSLRDVLRRKPLDVATGRIAQVLRACSMLSEAGERVALEISGPMTILNWLLDVSVMLREWRKDEALLREVLARLQGDLHRYALAAAQSGVAVLSYADPSGTVSILGPKRFAFVAEEFVLPFLRRLGTDTVFTAPVHVCPKTSHGLVKQERACWRNLSLARPMPYDEGCLVAGSTVRFLGQACLKNNGYVLSDGSIKELVLS